MYICFLNKKLSNYRGFTLVEILIVVSLVSLIASVVLYSYNEFNDKLTVSSASQEIAIAIRQSQSYGMSVREAVKGGGNFSAGYGAVFDISDANKKTYIVFADKNNDKVYKDAFSCTAGSECVEKNLLRNGAYVSSVCGTSYAGAETCSSGGSLSMLHITFYRPNPDATIYLTNAIGGASVGPFQKAKIILRSNQGRTVNIIIENTGQVSIQ